MESIYVLIKVHYSSLNNLSLQCSYDENIPLQKLLDV